MNYLHEENRNLRRALAVVARLRPGIILPDDMMAAVDPANLIVARTENGRGLYLFYKDVDYDRR